MMLTEFPVIHTNVWDAVWAVPAVFTLMIAAKWFFKVPSAYLPTVATVAALFISVLISHPKNLSAGIFMGFFYSGAAVGTLYSITHSYRAYRSR